MSTQYPYKKMVLPKGLRNQVNGRVDRVLLADVKAGGIMYKPVAKKFNRLYDAAKAAGITLVNVGDYRSFDRQLAMFLDRYEVAKPNDPRLKKPRTVTRKYDGKTWILKKGKAPSAVPDPTGRSGSNHGWGVAIDLAVEGKNGKVVGMVSARKAFKWMCVNAPTFGFYLQSSNPKSPEFKAWHWQYCDGGE